MLYWMCEKSKLPPTGPQLQHAIKRNFGGFEDFDTYEIFKQHISNLDDEPDMTNVPEMVMMLHCSLIIGLLLLLILLLFLLLLLLL